MPRSVPAIGFDAILAWETNGLRPKSRKSRWQKTRAKNPRSSVLRSRSMMNAPFSLVSVKITSGHQLLARLSGSGTYVPEIRGKHTVADQLLNVADPLVAGTFELAKR